MGLKDKVKNRLVGMQLLGSPEGIKQMMKDRCLTEARKKYAEKDLPEVSTVVEGMWEEKGVRASLGMVGLGKPALQEIVEYAIETLRYEREGSLEKV